jgi:hypothetical protein
VWLAMRFYLSFHGWTFHLRNWYTLFSLACMETSTLEIVQSVGACAQISALQIKLADLFNG